MTFTAVLFFCIAAIAACAGFVFLVETVVAFWLHDPEQMPALSQKTVAIQMVNREQSRDKAA